MRLRVEGRLALPEIAAKLRISKSTASIILKGFPLTEGELRARRVGNVARARAAVAARAPEVMVEPVTTGCRAGPTVFKGEVAVAKCLFRAAQLGMILGRPYAEVRYDAFLDTGKAVLRAQVKYIDTADVARGLVVVPLKKEKGRTYTADEIDVVLAYVPEIDRILWIGPELFSGKQSLCFRFIAARNNNRKLVRSAADYLW
jgi:hypothetical protein